MELFNNFTSTFDPSNSSSTTWNPLDIAAAALLGLCFLVGVPGNTAVLLVFPSRLEKDNFTQRLILNLACCDLLGLVTIPLWLYCLVHGWHLGRKLCKLFSFLVIWSICTNVITVTLMSVQRYVQVLHRHSWARLLSGWGERGLLAGVWVLAAVMTAPSLSVWDAFQRDGAHFCSRQAGTEQQVLATTLYEMSVLFLVPLSVITTSYSCLRWKVKRRALLCRTERMTRIVTRIVLCFMLVWVPMHVLSVVEVIIVHLRHASPDLADNLEGFKNRVENISYSCTFISAGMDPFLYALAFQSRRQQPRRRLPAAARLPSSLVLSSGGQSNVRSANIFDGSNTRAVNHENKAR